MAALLFWEAHSACKLARTQITCLRDAGRLFGEEGRTRRKIGNKKTRPSTQYTVNDLASPGY
jgi:hypothetical protein